MVLFPNIRGSQERKGLCKWFKNTELELLLEHKGNTWSGAIRGK